MSQKNLELGIAYVKTLANKNMDELPKYLDSEVHLLHPLGNSKGKEAVVKSAETAMKFFDSLTMHESFESGDQVMIVFELKGSFLVPSVRGSSLLDFHNEKITRIELFLDPKPMFKKDK